MPILSCVVTAIAVYLLGSIPTGFLAGKLRGVDVRTMGSGNIGATNAFRILGRTAGTVVLLIDALKGYLACVLLTRLVAVAFGTPRTPEMESRLMLVAGLGAVMGHNYTCWLEFKGGKGIATSAGVLLAWVPGSLLVAFITWLIVFVVSKYVSLASLAAAVVLPFAVWLLRSDTAYVWITTGLLALAIYKHKANIQRLLNGTEHRFGSGKPVPVSPP